MPLSALLLTDGGESCGRDPVRAAERLADDDPPIDLYVVAIGDLDLVADVADVAEAAGSRAALAAATTPAGSRRCFAASPIAPRSAASSSGRAAETSSRASTTTTAHSSSTIPRGLEGWRLGRDGEVLELRGATCGAWRAGAPLRIVWPCGR